MPRIVIIAGEASGDRLGASFIHSARALRPDLSFEGVAGPAMIEAGCDVWFDSHDLAVMGFFEVFRHLPRILKIRRAVVQRLLADPPDLLLGIDSPDFNLPVECIAHAAGIPVVHYVCPSVWAWRQSRVKTLRKSCDHVLCLLPFEATFLAEHDVAGTFIGHPLADEISGDSDRATARRLLGLESERVLALLPGSRMSEVSRLGPAFAETVAWLSKRDAGLGFVVAAVNAEIASWLEQCFRTHAPGCKIDVVTSQTHAAVIASDAVLVASGTATLEVMLLRRPMVVAYKLAASTYHLARLLNLIKVAHISLPNLLAGRTLVQELIQHEANPAAMGAGILELLGSPERQAELADEFGRLHAQLRRSAADRAAEKALGIAGLIK